MDNILLATDLDRTVIPNGPQPESPLARVLFAQLTSRRDITLAYVSGRNLTLLKEAISTYNLPTPSWAIGDVGTTIYRVDNLDTWQPLSEWEDEIATDWRGKSWADIKALFEDIDEIRLQDDNPAFQNAFKVSYYTQEDIDRDALIQRMSKQAQKHNLGLSFIFSIDEIKHIGLLDVLPQSATKLHALQFLRNHINIPEDQTIFCGDSGNDIPAFTSGLMAVLVKNTRKDVQDEVMATTSKKGIRDRIYIAQGDFLGMNGNYSAGVLEGIAYFIPEIKQWLNERLNEAKRQLHNPVS